MGNQKLIDDIRQELNQTPLFDIHTHLTDSRIGARGLHDVLLYHMVVSDLYSAGCPSGARLTEYPGWPTQEEAHRRIIEALPYLKHIQNTSCYWGVQIILRDLYKWNEPITEKNWKKLDDQICERADDRNWQRETMRKMQAKKFTTELARRMTGADDDILHYSMEWAFFTRTQRGEFDSALYELERCWGNSPGSPVPHAAKNKPKPHRVIRTMEDLKAAMDHYVGQLAGSPVISLATHISTDVVFRQVSDSEMKSALQRRDKAGLQERDIYTSYIHEMFLTALEPYADRIVFQLSIAAEPLPHETMSVVPQRALVEMAEIVARHPKMRFLVMLASRHANQTFCTMCRELPNMALAGYWWHNFFPGAIRQVMEERLDMLPMNRQMGFFSDAYCVEWAYAKSVMVRNQLAQVLAQKVEQGQYSRNMVGTIARGILYDSAEAFLKMMPAV